MRKFFVTAFVLAAMMVFATSALALEKTSVRLTDERADGWNASTTTTIAYYNICTGWVWVWSGWTAGDQIGVSFSGAGGGAALNTSWALSFSPAPSGYGFTGTISVENGTGCGAPLMSQPYLPPSGWGATAWGGLVVADPFTVAITWAAPTGFTNATAQASDHPAVGPTGPQSCGTCFPTARVSNSRDFGVAGAYCPSGTVLSDGVCNVELLIDVSLKRVVSVEDKSWGSIKNLYR